MNYPTHKVFSKVGLLVSDIDGTLITRNKILTVEAKQAAQNLKKAGIQLCLVSSRPALGMQQYIQALPVNTPFAALNGGAIFDGYGKILANIKIEAVDVARIYEILHTHKLETWFFSGSDWFVFTYKGDFIEKEIAAIQFTPKIIKTIEGCLQTTTKIMSVSQNTFLLDDVAQKINQLCGGRVVAVRSGDHYLDISNSQANKGSAVQKLAQLLNVPLNETACIGDMDNDIPMLKIAGISIAMGQSNEKVQTHADYITKTNEENGWAYAINHFLLS